MPVLFTEEDGEGDDSDRKREMDDQENRPPTTIKEDLFLEGEELPVRACTPNSRVSLLFFVTPFRHISSGRPLIIT